MLPANNHAVNETNGYVGKGLKTGLLRATMWQNESMQKYQPVWSIMSISNNGLLTIRLSVPG